MSQDLDGLKKLVLHTLETNGVLGQIRANLRANVYKAIDKEECADIPKGPHKLHSSAAGRLLAEIVTEFFEFYGFRHTLSVFHPESNNMIRDPRRSRADVAVDAGLGSQVVESSEFAESSILEHLISCSCTDLKKGEDWHSSASSTTASTPPPAPAIDPLLEKRPLLGKLPSLAPMSTVTNASELAPLNFPPKAFDSGAKETKDLGAKETKEPPVASGSGMSPSASQSMSQSAKSASLKNEATGDVNEDNFEMSIGSDNQESADLSYAEDAKRLQEIEAQIARLKSAEGAVAVTNSSGYNTGVGALAAVGTSTPSTVGVATSDIGKNSAATETENASMSVSEKENASISVGGASAASLSPSGSGSKGVAAPDASGSLSGGISGGPSQVLPNDESGNDEIPSEVEEDLGSISGFESNYDEENEI